MAGKSNFSVVIDVGTFWLTALAGTKNESGNIEILAQARVPSKGIKRGLILNIDEAASSVSEVLENIRSQIDEKITKVDIAFAGQLMKIFEYRVSVPASGEEIITRADVDELYAKAKNINISEEYTILHIVAQEFIIDDVPAELNPVGSIGNKVEAVFRIIAVPKVYLTNFRRIFNNIDIELGEVILSPLATAEAALTGDEKEIGAVLLDIGAGTTKLAVYYKGVMVYTAVIPFGGEVVTRDIKEGCSILPKWAEQLKVQYGQALGDFADERKVVTIPGHSGWEPKEITFKSLAFIIQARMEELIDSAFLQVERLDGFDNLDFGIVVSGGTSALKNLVSLIEFRTGKKARLAFPVFKAETGNGEVPDSGYLTALGLLKSVLESQGTVSKLKPKKEKKKKENTLSHWFNDVVQGVFDYMNDDQDTTMN